MLCRWSGFSCRLNLALFLFTTSDLSISARAIEQDSATQTPNVVVNLTRTPRQVNMTQQNVFVNMTRHRHVKVTRQNSHFSILRKGAVGQIEHADISSRTTHFNRITRDVIGTEVKHTNMNSGKSKSRRYTYEDTHQWPADDTLDYDFMDGEIKEAPLWERIGQNWQVVGLRLIFIFSALCVAIMLCCCCCQIALRAYCFNLQSVCNWGSAQEIITSCYQDPMYTKAKRTAALFGLKLDYKTYKRIKDQHDPGTSNALNPLGLPWMEN
ncbi:hypothetical protein Bpfe_017806 [Biomphalaria pfeifferi]|uniref:Uncharacterized protein n=1 Tax=Biomphalaria pfeifferi TaxID=112525 RepID=A0AAD8BDM8_BIOPF|nr:hypothetical protein Bpfe_017806 [Biomphalaria pfeifferi]